MTIESSRNQHLAVEQRRMQEESAANERALHAAQQLGKVAAGITLAGLEQMHPDLLERRNEAQVVRDSAAADLQDVQHRARQHAATPPANRDAVAAWAERRARLIAELEAFGHLAQQTESAYQQAKQALDAAVIRTRDALVLARTQAWNARGREIQAEFAEEVRRLQEKEAAFEREMQTRYDEQLVPLVNAGAVLPRQLQATGLFVIPE